MGLVSRDDMNDIRQHWFITIILAISFAFAPIVSAACLGDAPASMEMSDGSPCNDMADRKGCKCDCDAMDLASCKQMCTAVIFNTVAYDDVPLPFQPQSTVPNKIRVSLAVAVLIEPRPPKPSITL